MSLRVLWAVGVGLGATGAVPAQSFWQLRGAPAAVRVDGEQSFVLQGPVAFRAAADGEHTVHFGAVADGKPVSLQFPVPAGAAVALATHDSLPVAATAWPLDANWRTEAGWQTRTSDDVEQGDYRVIATVRVGGAAQQFGLVARHRGPDQLYRLVCDLAANELRLERQLGGPALSMLRAPLPTWAAGEVHELALQVKGFRMQAFLDDAPMLQCFDGALTKGAFGLCHRGEAPEWLRCGLAPPVGPTASAAAVQAGREVTLHARAPFTPGHWYVLELCLDRPHGVLVSTNGVEPWLLQRPAAPQLLLGDWRGSLARGVIGELGNDGSIALTFGLPDLQALRLRTALARWLLVSADGYEISGRTPAVPIRF